MLNLRHVIGMDGTGSPQVIRGGLGGRLVVIVFCHLTLYVLVVVHSFVVHFVHVVNGHRRRLFGCLHFDRQDVERGGEQEEEREEEAGSGNVAVWLSAGFRPVLTDGHVGGGLLLDVPIT